MKRFLSTTISFCLLMLSSGLARPADAEQPSVKAGAVLPLTGSSAVYGEWAQRGLQLAIDRENQWRKEQRLPLIVLLAEDNQFQGTTSITAFHSLFHQGVAAMFSTGSPIAMVLGPLANQQQLPLIDVSAAADKYSTADDYTFRTAVIAGTLVNRIKDYLASMPGGSRIGALIIESEYGQGMLDAFNGGNHLELVRVEAFMPREVYIRPQAVRLRGANIQVLWLVSQIKETSSLIQQLSQQLPKVQIVSDAYSVEAPEFLDQAGNLAEGIVYAAPGCLLSDISTVTELFLKMFREKYGSEPNFLEAQAFDAGRAFGYALRECGGAGRSCLRDALNKLDIEGACGRLKFDSKGDVQYKAVLKRIERHSFKLISE